MNKGLPSSPKKNVHEGECRESRCERWESMENGGGSYSYLSHIQREKTR